MLIKTFLAAIFSVLLFSASHAAILCPAPSHIHLGNLEAWQVYDSLSGEPASQQQIKDFEKDVGHFIVANWSKDFYDGPGQCFYETHGDIELVKDVPQPTNANWSKGSIVQKCSKSRMDCIFG